MNHIFTKGVRLSQISLFFYFFIFLKQFIWGGPGRSGWKSNIVNKSDYLWNFPSKNRAGVIRDPTTAGTGITFLEVMFWTGKNKILSNTRL